MINGNNPNGRFGLIVTDPVNQSLAVTNELLVSTVNGHVYIKAADGLLISKTVELENRLNNLYEVVERSNTKIYLSGFDWVTRSTITDRTRFTSRYDSTLDKYYTDVLCKQNTDILRVDLNRPINLNNSGKIRVVIKASINKTYANKTVIMKLRLNSNSSKSYDVKIEDGVTEAYFMVKETNDNEKYPSLLFTPDVIDATGANPAGGAVSIEYISIECIDDASIAGTNFLDNKYIESNIFQNSTSSKSVVIPFSKKIIFNSVRIRDGFISFTLLGYAAALPIHDYIDVEVIDSTGASVMTKRLDTTYLNTCTYTIPGQSGRFFVGIFTATLGKDLNTNRQYTVTVNGSSNAISFGYLLITPVSAGGYGV